MTFELFNTEYEYHTLVGDIDINSCNEAIHTIISCNTAHETERPEMINLIINSGGGDIYAAFSLIDVMNLSKIPVRTIGIGSVCSSALMILMGGHKGERYVSDRSIIMSHQYSSEIVGKEHEIKSAIAEADMMSARMHQYYVENTTESIDFIKERLLSHIDYYMTAETALKHGMVDHIITFGG